MTKKEILALSNEGIREQVDLILYRDTRLTRASGDLMRIYPDGQSVPVPDYPNDIGAVMTYLFESVYGRGGKIKGGAWVLGTVEGGRDVASATLLWKAQSGQKHRANKVTVIRPRGEMAKAITQVWVCGMLGVSDV